MKTIQLTRERIKKGWTQEDVAVMLGTTKQAVCNWEKSRSFPRRPILINLEKLFGLSHQELFAPAADEDPFSSSNNESH